MSIHTLLYWSMIGICGCIAIIGLAVIGCVFYVLVNMGIDAWQHNHRRAMATDASIEELKLRRLKKAVSIRAATMKIANKG